MPNSSTLEVRKDILGEKLYASRNDNDLSHTYKVCGANRANVDFVYTLRQHPTLHVKKTGTKSLPELRAMERSESRLREPLVAEHEDGPYHANTATMGKYQNFANTSHMLQGLTRVSSGSAHGIDWHLNLRNGSHQRPDNMWRRHCTRSHQSFDMLAENCSKDNEAYQNSHITPQDRRPDRRATAISIASIRDDKMSFRRWEGCEGTEVGQWRHLLEHREYGRKPKRQLKYETTLREKPGDTNGARIQDNRSDGCLVEMMGKKKWIGAQSHDPLARRPPEGDPKLHYLSNMRMMPEPDEENRRLRMEKCPRTDIGMSEERPRIGRRYIEDDD
mmetsp:Transcript_31078/g.71052  ORF Transcript_31078/g.71052 Transcript_31078/m.71052 type:complete len:332 (-) Transcript_31078:94-1089(-)